MLNVDLLTDQPTLVGDLVCLEAVGPHHLEGLWPLFADHLDDGVPDPSDPIGRFTRETVLAGLAKAAERGDRADWAVVRMSDGLVVGEVVLFDLDEDAESMTFRIALTGPSVFGRGYGSEATALARDFALGPLGLHRLALQVDADNDPAIAVYAKAGFVREGTRRDVVRRGRSWVAVHDMALLATDPRPGGR